MSENAKDSEIYNIITNHAVRYPRDTVLEIVFNWLARSGFSVVAAESQTH